MSFYRNGVLRAEGVPLPSTRLAFAVKANPNSAVLRSLAGQGYGADIVSGGELRRALGAGMAPSGIVFSGVGKSLPQNDVRLAPMPRRNAGHDYFERFQGKVVRESHLQPDGFVTQQRRQPDYTGPMTHGPISLSMDGTCGSRTVATIRG